MGEIKVKVDSQKDCVQTLSVELSASKVQQKIEAAFENVRSQVKLPGFRPGKSPMELIRQSYQDAAYSKAQDDLLREGVAEALKEKELDPIQSPVIQTMAFDPKKPFHFQFQVEVSPKFKLSSYKGLKLVKKAKAVSDEDVNKALSEIANMNARLVESKEEALSAAHFGVVDYEGSVDGKPLEGGKASNYLIDMSSPQTIAGLAEGLLGAKAGETRAIPVKFPVDSPMKELAGKEAVFQVKLHAVKQKKLPVLDDEFAKDLGIDSLAQLKQKVHENLESDAQKAGRRDLENQIIEKLLEENKFPLPQSLLDKQIEYSVKRQKDRLTKEGVSEADQEKLKDKIQATARQQADSELRVAYIFNAIAEAEKIEATPDEVRGKINKMLEHADTSNREVMAKALNGPYFDKVRTEVREAKLFDLMIAQAKLKDKE